jgi:hypothetical protein
LTASNRATPIGADYPVISAQTDISWINIVKCVSSIKADLQDAAVKAEIGVWA